MGRFDEKYSAEQRDAIRRAITDERATPRQACERARRGGLYGLEAFEFNVRTAADYATKWRRENSALKALQDGQVFGREGVKQSADLALSNVTERLRILSRKAKWTAQDAEMHRKLLQSLREIDSVYGRVPIVKGSSDRDKAASKATNGDGDQERTERSELVADLLAEMEQKKERNGQAQSRASEASKGAAPAQQGTS